MQTRGPGASPGFFVDRPARQELKGREQREGLEEMAAAVLASPERERAGVWRSLSDLQADKASIPRRQTGRNGNPNGPALFRPALALRSAGIEERPADGEEPNPGGELLSTGGEQRQPGGEGLKTGGVELNPGIEELKAGLLVQLSKNAPLRAEHKRMPNARKHVP